MSRRFHAGTLPHQFVKLSDIGDEELCTSVVLMLSKCGRFLFAYRQFAAADAESLRPASWFAFLVWRLNGAGEKATRIASVPLFGTSAQQPLVDVDMLQITLIMSADQSLALIFGQPSNPTGSVASKLCHVTAVSTPFCHVDRAQMVAFDDVCLTVLHLHYLVAPPYPSVVPRASFFEREPSRITLLLHCGSMVRQVGLRVTNSEMPSGSSSSAPGPSQAAATTTTGATPSTQLLSDASAHETPSASDSFDVFKYPRGPEELLRDFSCAGFDEQLDDESVELWLSCAYEHVIDARASRRIGMASMTRSVVRLERCNAAFDIERSLTAMRKRLPRLSDWMLIDYDARALVVTQADTLLLLCCALFRPRRLVGTRQCAMTALLSVSNRQCQLVQLLELANLDRPLAAFALNRKALGLSLEWRAKLAVPCSSWTTAQWACNAAVFRGESLTSLTAAGLPFSIVT